jgi:hypothetical protein
MRGGSAAGTGISKALKSTHHATLGTLVAIINQDIAQIKPSEAEVVAKELGSFLKGRDHARPVQMRTLLLYSAANGVIRSLDVLLGCSTKECNDKDNQGTTPLMAAAAHGHEACLKALLVAGANADARDDGDTNALHAAIKSNSVGCVDVLLSSFCYTRGQPGSKVSEEKMAENVITGMKGVQVAAWHNSAQVLQRLLERGAHIDARVEFNVRIGLLRGDPWYTDYTDTGSRGKPNELWFTSREKLEEIVIESGHTALTIAAYRGAAESIQNLLKHGADIASKTEDGRTAFHWCVAFLIGAPILCTRSYPMLNSGHVSASTIPVSSRSSPRPNAMFSSKTVKVRRGPICWKIALLEEFPRNRKSRGHK